MRHGRPCGVDVEGEIRVSRWSERIYIVNYLGALLAAVGALMLIPLVPLEIYGETVELRAFLEPALVCVAVGLLVQKRVPFRTPDVRDAMVITGLGWLLVCLAGAWPFVLGLGKGWVDAFFESVSGFTTTGITVFEGLDAMPRCILFWRSLIQWLGGLGILTFFLAVSFRGGGAAATLFGAEGHKISSARPAPGIFHTLKILWAIYIAITVTSGLLFWAAGMDLFDAVNHCLTCVSTGGFSTHDQSTGYYLARGVGWGRWIEWLTVVFMAMGGANFLIHYRVARGEWRALVKDFEMRWYWGIGFGAAALVYFDHVRVYGWPSGLQAFHDQVRAAVFQVVSMLTSTGYATLDINDAFFPALAKQVFLVLMVVGGCVGSTAGGIKCMRVGILARMVRTEIFRIQRPRRVVSPVVAAGRVLDDREIHRIAALVFAWLALIVLGAGVTAAFSSLSAWQALSGMASAVGNMGPFYFSVHTMAGLHPVIKLTYCLGMLAGRLEILPVFVLFSRSTWR